MSTAVMIDKGSSTDGPFHAAISMAIRDIDFNPTRGAVYVDAARQYVAEATSVASTARAYTAGKRVALQVQASKRGTVSFETSSSGGSNWQTAEFKQHIPGSEAHYALITPTGGTTHFRVRFEAFPDPEGAAAGWGKGSLSARGGAELTVTSQQID